MHENFDLRFSFEDLRKELEKIRGKMPRSTLYHWLEKMQIEPDLDGYYDLNDLAILRRLSVYLKNAHRIENFRRLIIQEIKNADQR